MQKKIVPLTFFPIRGAGRILNSGMRSKIKKFIFTSILMLSSIGAFNWGRIRERRGEAERTKARETQFMTAWKACGPAVYVEGSDPIGAAVQDRVPGLRVCAFLETGEYGFFEWHITDYGKPTAKMAHTWFPVGWWRP